nr:hypothetical protein [Ktedonobacteraceae bacterium]
MTARAVLRLSVSGPLSFRPRCGLRLRAYVSRPNPRDRRGTLIVIVQEVAKEVAPLFASGRKAQKAVTHKDAKDE